MVARMSLNKIFDRMVTAGSVSVFVNIALVAVAGRLQNINR